MASTPTALPDALGLPLRIFTASELTAFTTCPGKWDAAYRQLIARKVTMTTFRFGRAIHDGLAAYHMDPEPPEATRLTASQDAFHVAMEQDHRQALAAKDRLNRPLWTPELEQEYQESLTLGDAMLSTFDQWTQTTDTMRVIARERVLPPTALPRRLVRNRWGGISTRKTVGPRIAISGKLDGLVLNPHGRRWVREYKTVDQITSAYLSNLRRDIQPTVYLWILRTIGEPADGVEYVLLRKQAPSPKVKNPLLVRELITRTDAELDAFEIFLGKVTAYLVGKPFIYLAPGIHCGYCQMKLVCPDWSPDMIQDFMRRKSSPHEELEEPKEVPDGRPEIAAVVA